MVVYSKLIYMEDTVAQEKNKIEIEPAHPIILFDGVCNLCNTAVQFVLKRDKKNIFRFASLQSDYGQEILRRLDMPSESFNTFILIEKDKVYFKSTAALLVSKRFGGLWSLLYVGIIVPPFIRNAVYDFIARNRYRWFGQKEVCMIPTPELKSRFIN